MKAPKWNETRDILTAVAAIVVVGVLAYIGFKVVDTLKTGGSIIEGAVDTVKTEVGNVYNFATGNTDALLGPVPFDPGASTRVYDPSLDTRTWWERIWTLPPASAYVTPVQFGGMVP